MKTTTICALALFLASSAVAEEKRELLVSSLFVDPSMAAPVIRYDVDRETSDYSIGLSGWTLHGEWHRQAAGQWQWMAAADATPMNAHNSNRVYNDGRRQSWREYENASYRVRGGLRLDNDFARLELLMVGQYEIVDHPDARIDDRWKDPYAGIEVGYHYRLPEEKSNPLISSIEGVDLEVRGKVMAGDRSWGQAVVTQQWGRTLGRFHLRQAAAAVFTDNADTVNSLIAGGSWDSLGGLAVYGTQYGELRIDYGVLGSVGADFLLTDRLRIGARTTLALTETLVQGYAVNASFIFKTVGVNAGIGKADYDYGAVDDLRVYAAVIVPLYRR